MIPYGRHHIDEGDIAAVSDLLRHGSLTQGPKVAEFERALADYVGSRYAVAVSSATSGLHLAAIAAGVGPGSALVTSPITFIASANAALYAGGSPLFADIDPATINMCPDALEKTLKRHPETKAVVPVHFAGLPCDAQRIGAVAAKAGAMVIEDAAHALGARYPDGSAVGSNPHSHMTVFSFHPVKAIAAGEGGAITTNDEALYRRLLRLRGHGINKEGDALEFPDLAETEGVTNPWYYEMQELGFNFRITEIQCALALSQLKKLDAFVARRQQLASAYDEAFASFNNLKPAQSTRKGSGLHIYVVRIKFEKIGRTRADVMRALRERGIGSQVHYIPVPNQPFYLRLGSGEVSYPAAQDYYNEALTLPLYYDLTDDQQSKVIGAMRDIVG